MDDTYRTGGLIPHENVRYAFTPHMNHRLTPEFAVTRLLWFDQHLRGSLALPKTPETHLIFETRDHVPVLEVRPDSSQDVAEVRVYYSVDPDPRARFWRSAEVTKAGDKLWAGRLPIMSVDQPLFAFANVVYRLRKSESEPHASPTERFALSSTLHTVAPKAVAANGASATDRADPVVDDFSHGWRDWYTLSGDNPHHWEFSTRKLADPKWRGQPGLRLAVEIQAERPNELVVVLTENVFRGYRGKQQEFVAVVRLNGGKDTQAVSLEPKDFQDSDGKALSGWTNVDLLSFRAYCDNGEKLLGSKSWAGPRRMTLPSTRAGDAVGAVLRRRSGLTSRALAPCGGDSSPPPDFSRAHRSAFFSPGGEGRRKRHTEKQTAVVVRFHPTPRGRP